MRQAEELEAHASAAKVFVVVYVLLVLSVGSGLFLFLTAQSKLHAMVAQSASFGAYEKLGTDRGTSSNPDSSTFGEYIDRIIECEDDDDEEEEEEVDIVYMSKDGTVYRKFKCGLLDEDEVELEYDDESFSYRWRADEDGRLGWKQLLPMKTKRTTEHTSHTCLFGSSWKFLALFGSSDRKPHVEQL